MNASTLERSKRWTAILWMILSGGTPSRPQALFNLNANGASTITTLSTTDRNSGLSRMMADSITQNGSLPKNTSEAPLPSNRELCIAFHLLKSASTAGWTMLSSVLSLSGEEKANDESRALSNEPSACLIPQPKASSIASSKESSLA